jgi:hypothetical protein
MPQTGIIRSTKVPLPHATMTCLQYWRCSSCTSLRTLTYPPRKPSLLTYNVLYRKDTEFDFDKVVDVADSSRKCAGRPVAQLCVIKSRAGNYNCDLPSVAEISALREVRSFQTFCRPCVF